MSQPIIQRIDINKFMEENKEKYELVSDFQYKINHISQESYPETISFIESHSDFFFKDYDSSLFFISNLEHFSLYNYKQLELILDIAVHFDDKLKKTNITDVDYFKSCETFMNSVNYLFYKNLISISTIINYSEHPEMIINFYPEIKEYDPQYADQAIKKIFIVNSNSKDIERLQNFYKQVNSDPKQHISNRIQNYHPSLLHKAIRDDDISTFQQLVSQNNYNYNKKIQNSYYERTCTKDPHLSLIQTAALYGSVRIFKFLWMQKNIELDENLQFYSYSGRNLEIIHLCEQKCSFNGVLRYAIHTHQNELVDYYLDNFEDQMEKDPPKLNEVLKKFNDDDENPYRCLNYEGLKDILRAMNWKLIFHCLPKIVFIVENYEDNSFYKNSKESSLIESTIRDMTLFRFIYSHKNPEFKFTDNRFIPYIYVLNRYAPNVFKYLVKNENEDDKTLWALFTFFIKYFPCKAIPLLEILNEDKEGSLFSYFACQFNLEIFCSIFNKYNEDLVALLFHLFNDHLYFLMFEIFHIDQIMTRMISQKMIQSLIKRISQYLPKEKIQDMIKRFDTLEE